MGKFVSSLCGLSTDIRTNKGQNNRGGGRGRGRGRGRGGGGGGGGGGRGRGGQRISAQDIDRSNEKLERYYNGLDILDEDEKEAFWSAMRSDLPNSFRFAGSRG